MLLVLFGVITGVALGLTGGGGSIFALPLLLHGAHSSVAQAVAISALAVGAAALVGAAKGLRNGLVDRRSALMFAATGALAAPLGVHAGALLADTTRIAAFSVLLIVMAALMWRNARAPEAQVVRATVLGEAQRELSGPACRYSPEGKLHLSAPCAIALLLGGFATGVLSGLFGVGGGFLIVPTLRATTGLSMHRAIATSLLVIALISASTVFASWSGADGFELRTAGPFVVGSVAGLLIGAMVAARLAGRALQRTFAAVIALVGLGLLVQTYLSASGATSTSSVSPATSGQPP